MACEKILIVGDDKELSHIVKMQLRRQGFLVSLADSYNKTCALMVNNEYDLIILDIKLPDTNGIEFCTKIRKKTYCPIIFASYMKDKSMIISALQHGGDDYIIKPVDTDMLMAKVYANLRRTKKYGGVVKRNELYFKDFMVEQSKHAVWKINSEGEKVEKVKLSPTEYQLLITFIKNKNNILSYENLYKDVWKTEYSEDVRTVMVHVSNLRKKLYGNQESMIHTVRGEGYVFCDT